MLPQHPIQGYIEGYYGRLFSWQERHRIVDALRDLNLNTYCYAPKEDAKHRSMWRLAYGPTWRSNFRRFCDYAIDSGISIVAGIAPGLDFDYAQLHGPDFDALLAKARQLRADGSSAIILLMDDIDTGFEHRCGTFNEEGTAHAALINKLSEHLAEPVFAVPRVYADELASDHNKPLNPQLLDNEIPDTNLAVAGSTRYLRLFVSQLDPHCPILYCGKTIVAEAPKHEDIQQISELDQHRIIIWDNLYAHDYCPRRLFIGPWVNREACSDVLLNPTGLPETDLLLLEIMANTLNADSHSSGSPQELRKQALKKHRVPESFDSIEHYFWLPHFSGKELPDTAQPDSAAIDEFEQHKQRLVQQHEAIDELLWHWKSDLSREWYPFLMSLKQDLSLYQRNLTAERLYKSYSQPLAHTIVNAQILDQY